MSAPAGPAGREGSAVGTPRLALSLDEVHVWVASIAEEPESPGPRAAESDTRMATRGSAAAGSRSGLYAILSPSELERAGRFRFERDRRRYVVAHAWLRRLLALYTGRDPAGLSFRLGPHGKPSLEGETAREGLSFNMSHSGEVALYALARGRRVGVDVEKVRPDIEHQALAGRFFSPREAQSLRGLPAKARLRAFYACWTRKEAYLKGRGEGLSFSPRLFTVTLRPDEVPSLVEVNADASDASHWSLRDVSSSVPTGYVAAVAVEGPSFALEIRPVAAAPLAAPLSDDEPQQGRQGQPESPGAGRHDQEPHR